VKNVADQLHSTRDRLRVRLERLVATFGAMWCHQVSDEGVRLAGAQSKLYLADPLIARLPSLLDASAPPPGFTASTEAALAVALARSIDALHPSRLIEQRAVGYLRTGSGNEVDFAAMPIAVGGQRTLTCPIEAKWVTDGWRSEARTIAGKYGRGVVATKNIIDLNGPVWAIPAPILALLLAA
jgi:predicted AAA+ superfamily ATPase